MLCLAAKRLPAVSRWAEGRARRSQHGAEGFVALYLLPDPSLSPRFGQVKLFTVGDVPAPGGGSFFAGRSGDTAATAEEV